MSKLSPLTISLLAATAAAQSVVSPAHFTQAEGPSNNSFPFGVSTAPFRYLNIHDDLAGTPRVIRGMSLRRNHNSAASAAYTVTLDGWMSTAVTTGTSPNATFDNNHGTDKAQVITGRTYNFPASPRAFAPEPWTFDVPFDTPFSYAGAASLCWEVQVTARTNTTSYFLDAASGSGSTNPAMAFNTFGTGCLASGAASPMNATGASSMNWPGGTGNLIVNVTNGPISAPAVMVFGVNVLPMPILIPGSDVGPSGPCHVYTDILLTLNGTTSATRTAQFTIPYPATPNLNGLRTFEQVAALDANANSFGLVTSSAVNHNVVAPYGPIPGARVFLSGSLGATGSVGASFSLVVRFNL